MKMNINDLPSEILTLVLKHTVGRQAQSMQNWKSSIQLLAVCQKWRILVSPWVHYWAFVECHDAFEDECVSDIISGTNTPTTTYNFGGQEIEDDALDVVDGDDFLDEALTTDQIAENNVWATNIDFHKLRGCTSRIRKLGIYLSANIPLVLFLHKACAVLELDSIQWSGLRYMLIDIFSVPTEVVELDEPVDIQIATVKNAALLIAQSINKVKTLIINNQVAHCSDEISMAFGSMLINAYSDQLTEVSSQLNTQLTKPLLASRLKYVKLFLDESATLADTHIPTECLEYMFLVNAPLEFPWKIFHKNPGDSTISMPNLDYLGIIFSYYRQTSNDNIIQPAEDSKFESMLKNAKPKQALALPMVKTLRLEYPPPDCPIFYSFPEPHRLHCLHISAPFAALQQVRHMNIVSVDTIDIYLDNISAYHKESFYTTTNYLFGGISVGKESAFVIRTRLPFKLDTDKVKWGNLQSLDLNGVIEFSTLLKLIERLGSLEQLIFRNINIRDFMEDVEYIDSPRWRLLLKSPLKSNISVLGALGKYQQQSTHCISNTIHFLIQRIRSLKKACIVQRRLQNQIDALLTQSPEPHPNVHNIIYAGSD